MLCYAQSVVVTPILRAARGGVGMAAERRGRFPLILLHQNTTLL